MVIRVCRSVAGVARWPTVWRILVPVVVTFSMAQFATQPPRRNAG